MPNRGLRAILPLRKPCWGIEPRSRRTLCALVAFLVLSGVATGIVVAATTEIGFEEYADGTGLTIQYENVGVVFEPQGDETAGAIVTTCGSSSDYCTGARTGENVIRTPIGREENRPLVVRFTEPKQEIALYVREFSWYTAQVTARLTARDSDGVVVDRTGIQFDSDTGWHRISVSTTDPEIAQVTLTMTDTGQTREHNNFIVDDLTARVNEPPEPAFTYDPNNPSVGETVKFDALASADADGTIVEYRWDLNGDESIDEITERTSAATTFGEPGEHRVTLEVVDDDGATDSITRTVTVAEPLVARCSIPDTEVTPGDQVVIDASASTADLVRFDTDGDGSFDRTNDDTFRELVRYTAPGTYTPVIRAERAGETDTVTCGVVTVESTSAGLPWIDLVIGGTGGTTGIWLLRRIYRRAKKLIEDEPNNPPIPSISYTPEKPSSFRPVLIDGSLSMDPDPNDRIVSYKWTIEDNELTVPRVVHAFLEPGDYDVELQITDSRGAMGSVTETIAVEDEGGEFALTHVHPDAPGNDLENLDQEYLVFENTGTDALDISGWTIHDAAQEQNRVSPGRHTFEFPADTILEPAETLAVHTGTEPATDAPTVDSHGDRSVFWGSNQAIWNNQEDAVVVQDDQENPITAVRYVRNEGGGYDIEPLDVEALADWFPGGPDTSPDAPVRIPDDPIGRIREGLSNGLAFAAGSLFLRGPRRFLACWATITGFLIAGSFTWGASISLGVVTPSFEPIVPLLLVSVATMLLVVGVVWLLASLAVSFLVSLFS